MLRKGSAEEWRLSRRASVSQGDVAYDIFGSGPPVVLVHGTPSWSYLWRNVAPTLASRFSVYVFDLPGYGYSQAAPDADISIASHARTLVELLDQWDLEAPAIAGHDIGGAVALRAHLLHDCVFRQIALVDAVVFAPWITPTTRHVQAHIDAYRTMPTHIFEVFTATHLRTAVHGVLDEQTLSAYRRPWAGQDGQAAYLQKVAHFNEGDTIEFEPLLTTVRVPVRIVWGAEDAWLSPALATRLRDTIPGADLVVLPAAGHFAMEDAPEEVADALFQFFSARIDGGG